MVLIHRATNTNSLLKPISLQFGLPKRIGYHILTVRKQFWIMKLLFDVKLKFEPRGIIITILPFLCLRIYNFPAQGTNLEIKSTFFVQIAGSLSRLWTKNRTGKFRKRRIWLVHKRVGGFGNEIVLVNQLQQQISGGHCASWTCNKVLSNIFSWKFFQNKEDFAENLYIK